MDSNMVLLRRKVCQKINRAAKEAKPRSQFVNGYIAALAQVVRLIDKMKYTDTVADAAVDDYKDKVMEDIRAGRGLKPIIREDE